MTETHDVIDELFGLDSIAQRRDDVGCNKKLTTMLNSFLSAYSTNQEREKAKKENRNPNSINPIRHRIETKVFLSAINSNLTLKNDFESCLDESDIYKFVKKHKAEIIKLALDCRNNLGAKPKNETASIRRSLVKCVRSFRNNDDAMVVCKKLFCVSLPKVNRPEGFSADKEWEKFFNNPSIYNWEISK